MNLIGGVCKSGDKIAQYLMTLCIWKPSSSFWNRYRLSKRNVSYQSLSRSLLKVEKLDEKEKRSKTPNSSLIFGHTFTDHMLCIEWKNETAASHIDTFGIKANNIIGWDTPVIKKYAPLSLSPASIVLHYGMEAFEGMKAYKDAHGKLRLFRPMMNMKRLATSAERLSLPVFDQEQFLECIKELVRVDKDWIPEERGYSLYIRPTIIGTQDWLGVGPTNRALLYAICCPVGPYYKTGFSAVSLLAEEKFVRAWPGGTGNCKAGGNYAPGILPQAQASKAGHQQILWLFGLDSCLTEVGTMNLFVFWKNEEGQKELITPPLDGTILPGVTRDSLLTLARHWNEFIVSERKITMHQIIKASHENRLLEMFGSGTAAIVSPIKHIHWRGKGFDIPLDPSKPDSQAGPLAKRFADTILDIQYGVKKFEDWSMVI